MPNSCRNIFLLTFFISVNFANPAYAYLDAGTGSMILQLLIAGVAGALVMIKVYWYKLKRLVTRSQDSEDENVEESDS